MSPKVSKEKEGETNEVADRASFKIHSQDIGLKSIFSRCFSFQIEKRKAELNFFIHVKEYDVCCHLLMPQCIYHWEAHSNMLSKWFMKNGHKICLKLNKLDAFIYLSKTKLLLFAYYSMNLACV